MQQVADHQQSTGRYHTGQSAEQHGLLGLGIDRRGVDLHVAHCLAGACLDLFHDHVRRDLRDRLRDLARQARVLIGHRNGHDLGGVDAAHRDAVCQLAVGYVQAHPLDDIVEHEVALDDDCIGVDHVFCRGDVVVAHGRRVILPGIDDHVDGRLIPGRQRERAYQKADHRRHKAHRHDLQHMAPQKPQQLAQVDHFFFHFHLSHRLSQLKLRGNMPFASLKIDAEKQRL